MPIELLLVLGGLALILLFMGVIKLPKWTGSGTGVATATGSVFSAMRSLLSWPLITIYGVILGIMALMLILVPTTWLSKVGDTYQTVALTMILVGLFLLAISSGKRVGVGIMIVAFVFLAFNKPEETAERVETAKSQGVTAIFKPAPPTPATPEEQAQRMAVAKQQAEIAAAQRVIDAKAQVEAQIAAERAQEAAYLPAEVGPCLMMYTDEPDCKTVKFEAKTKYDRYAPPGHCVIRVGDGVTSEPLGAESGWRRYKAERPTLVQFFTGTGQRCVP